MVVAWNMSEQNILSHTQNEDRRFPCITSNILLTVFTSLTTAVEIGLILAVILFTKRMSNMLVISKVLPDHTKRMKIVIACGK